MSDDRDPRDGASSADELELVPVPGDAAVRGGRAETPWILPFRGGCLTASARPRDLAAFEATLRNGELMVVRLCVELGVDAMTALLESVMLARGVELTARDRAGAHAFATTYVGWLGPQSRLADWVSAQARLEKLTRAPRLAPAELHECRALIGCLPACLRYRWQVCLRAKAGGAHEPAQGRLTTGLRGN